MFRLEMSVFAVARNMGMPVGSCLWGSYTQQLTHDELDNASRLINNTEGLEPAPCI